MRVLLLMVTAGFVVQLAFSAIVTHWFPRPNLDRVAWNTAKEAALDTVGLEETQAAH